MTPEAVETKYLVPPHRYPELGPIKLNAVALKGVTEPSLDGLLAVARSLDSARTRAESRVERFIEAALYGATGGRVFIAGAASERFAAHNSGAVAVGEGGGISHGVG